MNVKEFFKGRTVGFWLYFGSAAMMLIADILFVILDSGDRTFSLITFFAVLAGAAVAIAGAFLKLDFLPMITAALYGVGLGMHLYLGLPTLSDVLNEVNFVGGNPTMVIVFGILFFIGLVACIVGGFLSQERKGGMEQITAA